jgi:hypothetical protein
VNVFRAVFKPYVEIARLSTENKKLRKQMDSLLKWVQTTHRLSAPAEKVRALLQKAKTPAVIAVLTIATSATGQPFLHTFFTTNTTAVIMAAVSAGGTNSRQGGALTLTNLSNEPNVATNISGAGTVTVTSNNAGGWTITGAAGATGVTTNANQFGPSVQLTLRAGAAQTNGNFFGLSTNHGNLRVEGDFVVQSGDAFFENIFPALDDNYFLGSGSAAWNQIAVRSAGLQLMETGGGTDFVRHLGPASLAATYSVIWPNVQGADGSSPTNDGSGNLGWWPVSAVVATKASQTDLTTASNVLNARIVANDTTTSNGVVALLVANDTITSNGVVTLLVGNDTTTSNALRSLLIANDTTTSNGVVSLLVANDTTTSNALRTLLIANDTTTSNGVVSLLVANDTITSNGVVTLLVANDTTTSNALRTLLIANDTTTSNGVVALVDGKIDKLNGTGTNFSASRFTGTTNWPLVVRDTNGTMVVGVDTNGVLYAGGVTNSGSLNQVGGQTNWRGMQVNGTLLADSNLLVSAGQSVSNAWAGGTIVWDLNNYTNLNGSVTTFSNLANCTIPAHTLTNNGDMIRAYWGGVSATAMQNTQNFQIVYGSTTLLDTGLQIGSNYLYRAFVEITRTGNNSQHVDAKLEWLPNALGLTGLPWASTNVMRETLVETNGINTVLALKASARRVGALTNTQFRVYYDPAVR